MRGLQVAIMPLGVAVMVFVKVLSFIEVSSLLKYIEVPTFSVVPRVHFDE